MSGRDEDGRDEAALNADGNRVKVTLRLSKAARLKIAERGSRGGGMIETKMNRG